MGVSVKGSEGFFKVNLLNGDERKLVLENEFTQWLFDVLPLTAGNPSLTLTAYVVLASPIGEKDYERPVFVKEIRVLAAPKRPISTVVSTFFVRNWDKVIGVLVSTGVLGGLVAWLRKRRASRKPSPRWESL